MTGRSDSPTRAPTTYREALNWVYAFSDTERTGAFVRDRDDNLRRERALLAALGDPQRTYRITHIAGSKGKGSTSAMLASMLRASGARTGLYTSPDLHTFRERIRVDGQPIAERDVTRLVARLQSAFAGLDPALGSYITWEIATALAFLAFRDAAVEQAVIEVGLGGRLDATNVVEAPALKICGITSISYDHMAVLGNTLTEIAGEKAGIIKPGIPVITSAQAPEALAEIRRVAAERGAPLLRVGPAGVSDCAYTYTPGEASETGQRFDVTTPTRVYRDLEIPLLGEHQLENATLALALAEPLDERAIREGLRQTRWEGRLQLVGHGPWRVVDGAHNADSLRALFVALRRHYRFERLVLVFGAMADKDLDGMLREIAAARVDAVVATMARSPRAIDPTTLEARVAEQTSAAVYAEPDATAAIARAVALAGPRDMVCVAGSLYLAAEALRWFAAQPETPPGSIEIAGRDHT
ncbi:MAG TPA: folylpolyglutamate synthase/dihydrofolate synthase family protein [Ktedonobacterales bacterium]|nr:folylpolyglutamate synthase/dihydrofolate synthase family protein [Ktedonobacterales bacterium]